MKEWSGVASGNTPLDSSGIKLNTHGGLGHICYVDDSKTSAYVTQKILTEQGFQVDHYNSAEPAVVAVLQKNFDLLITNMNLDNAGMDGDELVRFIRRSGHPLKKLLPVIVITGNTEKETLLRLYEAGANAVLVKPISGEVLVEKVRDLIPSRQAVMAPLSGFDLPPQEAPFDQPAAAPTPSAQAAAASSAGNAAPPRTPASPRPRPGAPLPPRSTIRGGTTAGAAARPHATPPKPRPPHAPHIPSGNRIPARPPSAPAAPPVMNQSLGQRMQTQPPLPDDLSDLPVSPFAPAGNNLTQALKGAVITAVEKISEKSRQGLERLAGHRQQGSFWEHQEHSKKQMNDAAALIAKLRAQARAKAADAADSPQNYPDEKPVPAAVRPRQHDARPAEPAVPTTRKPPVREKEANHFNIEQAAPSETDFENLFSGLIPGQERPASTQSEAKRENAAPEPIAGDKKMITALDINLDLVNFQDTLYQSPYGNMSSEILGRIALLVKQYKIIIGAGVIAILLLFTGVGDFFTGGTAVEVETVRVGLGNIHQAIVVPGKVVSKMKVDVSPSSPGQIVSLKANEGSQVKKGDILAELENEQAISDLKRSEGNLLSAQEETALAEKTWRRMNNAFQLGAVSKYAVDEAEAALKSARARESVAKEEVRSTRLSLDKLSILAPFSGTVTARHVQVGQWVSPSEAIFTLVDLSAKEIEVKVDSADSSSIKIGQVVALTSDAYPGQRWMESVSRVAPAANREDSANTVSVFVTLGSSAPELRFGQQVDAEIRTSSSNNIIKLPIEALITRNGKTWVAVIENGKVHFSPVVIGLEDFTHVEILQGVKPRQEVIMPRDASSLHEGDAVRIVATQTVE